VIKALRVKDMGFAEVQKFSNVPCGRLYGILAELINKKIVEKKYCHKWFKLKKNKVKDLTEIIEKSSEFGFQIRIMGLRKLKPVYHLNGNLEKYCDKKIEETVKNLEKTKSSLMGV
jgi:hypothetical protein